MGFADPSPQGVKTASSRRAGQRREGSEAASSLIPHPAPFPRPHLRENSISHLQTENSLSRLLNTSQSDPFHYMSPGKLLAYQLCNQLLRQNSSSDLADGLPRRKGVRVGHAHPHIPPQEEMGKCKGDSKQIACDYLLLVPYDPYLKTPPPFQFWQILRLWQHPAKPDLFPQRSGAMGVLLPRPLSSRFPKWGAAQYWWSFPFLSARRAIALPPPFFFFFTCARLVGSGCSGVDSCGCRLPVPAALQGKRMTPPPPPSEPEPPDGAAPHSRPARGSEVEAARFPLQRRPPPPTGRALPAAAASVSFCPLIQKSLMSGTERPISGARGRPPLSASGPEAIASKRGEPAGGGCGTRPREPAPCQVQLGRTDRADLHLTREFAASPSLSFSLTPSSISTLFPPRFETGCVKHEVGQKSSEQ